MNDYDALVDTLEDEQPPQAKQPEANPYLDLIDQQTQKQTVLVGETLRGGAKTSPDQRAEDLKLSDHFKMPVDVVERNRDYFKQRREAEQPMLHQIIDRSPKLSEWLSQHPDTAPAAQDDLPAMVKLENDLTFGASILRGVDNTQALFGRFVEWAGDATNSDNLREYGRDVALFNEAQSEALGKKWTFGAIKNPWDFAQYVKETIGEQLPIMAPMVAGGVAGAAVGSVVPVVGTTVGGVLGAFFPALMMGVGETQGAIKELDPEAEAPGWAFLGGSAIAAFDTALPGHIGSRLVRMFGKETAEEIAKKALTAQLKPQFVRSLAKEGAGSMATEGITEALQEAIGDVAAAQGAQKPMDWNATWKGMLEAGAAGALVGGSFGASGVALTHNTEVARYAQAQQTKLFFDELAAGATDSKLRERLPEAYKSFVAKATADGPVANVYVGTEEFVTYWQSKGVNPAVMAQQLTGNPLALEQAQEAGTKLSIPTAEYATQVAATEHHAWFANEMTLSPDALNARQAKEVQAELETLATSITDAVQKAANGDVVTSAGGPIQQSVRTQLEADPGFVQMAAGQGVDVTQAANTYAAGVEAVFTTLATRLGKDPQELFASFGLRFGAQNAPAAAPVQPGEAKSSPAMPLDPAEAEALLGAPDAPQGQREAPRLQTLVDQLGEEGVGQLLGMHPAGGLELQLGGELTSARDATIRRRGPDSAEAPADFPFEELVSWVTGQADLTEAEQPDAGERENANALLGRAREALGLTELEQAAKAKTEKKQPPVPSLLRAPADVSQGRMRISTRVPYAMKAVAAIRRLRTDLSVVQQSVDKGKKKGAHTKLAALFATYPIVPQAVRDQGPDAVLQAAIDQMKRNLRQLWFAMPEATRNRAKTWYVGAHRIALDLADEYGYTDQQAAALLAVLSPKIDWFKNVAYARAASRAFAELERDNPVFSKQLFEHYRQRVLDGFETAESTRDIRKEFGEEGVDREREKLKRELRDDRKRYQDIAWSDQPIDGQARLMRAYIETRAERPGEAPDLSYPVILPEGENGNTKLTKDGKPALMGWTSFPITSQAIRIMRDGSPSVIQNALGGEHKVRSFFNNISDPWDPDSVTIDTHAVAAALLQPLSSKSAQVKATMSGFADAMLGLSGANAIYAEAYFQLAEELGVLPREVQSVTWEQVRLLWPPEQKRADAPARVEKNWADFAAGIIETEEALYAELLNQPGAAERADWADHPPRVALDESGLRQGTGIPLRPDVSARRGDRSGSAPGSPRQNANLAEGPVVLFQGAAADAAADSGVDAAALRRSSVTRALGRIHSGSAQPYVSGSPGRVEGVRGLTYNATLPLSVALTSAHFPATPIIELEGGSESAALFRSKIAASKAASRYGAAVFVYDQTDYEGMRLFLTDNGDHGFAIKPDGDIVSVFSKGGGYVYGMLALATQLGGTKLDCFDTVLPDLYATNGFKVVKREPWNDAYAPEGWDPATFHRYNDGKPDIVYMEFDPVALQTGPVTLFQSAPNENTTATEWAYSRLVKAVELSTLKRASGQQWKATIKNAKIGQNIDEFMLANVDSLEDGQSYTREEVLEYLKANQLQVAWDVLGGEGPPASAIRERANAIFEWSVNDQVRRIEERYSDFGDGSFADAQMVAPEDGETGDWWQAYVDEEPLEDEVYDNEAEAREAAQKEADRRNDIRAKEIRRVAAQNVNWDEVLELAKEQLGANDEQTQFSAYVEPGGDPGSYREVLLHAPQLGRTGFKALDNTENARMMDGMALDRREIRERAHADVDTQAERDAMVNAYIDSTIERMFKKLETARKQDDQWTIRRLTTDMAILRKLQASGDWTWTQAGWVDGHAQYASTPNPIVRLRFNQRTLPDGRTMLFLEEVQPPQEQNFKKMPPLLQKNWRELGFKWALAHAAELGVDMVGWTTGQMQADRYNLANVVNDVTWNPSSGEQTEDATRRIVLDIGEGKLILHTDADMKVVEALERNYNGTVNHGADTEQYVGVQLEEIIGKEMTAEIASAEKGHRKPKDMVFGGEGLRRLYDSDFRNVVNKLPVVKKHGGRVGQVDVDFSDDVTQLQRQQAEAAGVPVADQPPPVMKPVPAIELTPAMKESVEQGQTLFQGERGKITFGRDRKQFNVQLLKDADLSTVIHELGHFYLEVLGELTAELRQADPSSLEAGQAGLVKDYQTILNWLGVSDRSEIGVEHHEQFARGFEAYLREGTAPSPELRDAFARMRTWMVALYRNVTALAVNLTPEVRGVFDRLVATDDAIERAKAEGSFEPFATAEQAGMTDIEFKAYLETARRANEAARDALQAKIMRELQQERTAFWKQQTAKVKLEVTADVVNRRNQIAFSVLTVGQMPLGAPAPQGAEDLKINKQSIVDRYGAERLKTLPKPWVYAVEGGVDVEQVAELFGYASGDELMTDLAQTEKAEVVIARETTQRMKAEHGDMRIDGTLAAAAKRAVTDNGHDAVLAMELRALARKAREVLPFIRADQTQSKVEQKSALKALLDALNNMAPADQVRATAEERISKMRVRDIKPSVYWAAARDAGQRAMKAAASGRYELALKEKTTQRLAAAMHRAATAALEEVEVVGRYANRLQKPGPRARIGKAGESYLQQIDTLLDKYEFANVPEKQLQKRETLIAWVAKRQADGYDTSSIPAELLEAANRTNYKSLSLEQLRIVRDAIKQIDSMASLKNRLLANKDARAFVKVRDELVAQVEAGSDGGKLPIEFREAETRKHAIATWFASHSKIARLARALDGYVDAGPFWRAIIRPLNEAADAEQTRRQAEGARYAQIIKAHYPGRELAKWNEKVEIAGVGSLSLEARLAVALNWGNESNRSRLLSDPRRQWTERDVQNILATLSRNDWLFVQDTWDYVDSFWQEISDKQQRVTGLRPEKVEASPVDTPHGQFRGGYYPLAYDSRMSARAGQVAAATEATLAMGAAYVRTTTKRGHVETRLENVELPVRLDLGVMFNHVDQVIHDLTHHEVLIDVGRLLRDKRVSQSMIDVAGEPVYKQFTDALTDIATGGKGAANIMDRAATFMRTGTQVVAMGYNLWTALQQPMGLFNGAARVGPTWVARGMTRWLRDAAHMENTVAWIHQVSPMMRGRASTATQDIADLRKTLQHPGGWFDSLLREVTRDAVTKQTLMDSYLWHIGLAQRVADVPTWLGAYEKAMAQGQPEETAYRLADQAVLDSQGGGSIKDLAAVQRGGPVAKLFMVFYSYGNTVYNSTAEVYGRAQLKNPIGVAQFIGNLSLIYVFPAFGTVLLAKLVGRDDDEDDFITEVGKEMLATALNTMVLVRELGGLVREGTRGYEGPAGTRFLSLLYRLGTQVQQGEPDEALLKALNQVAGVLFRYPASQVQKTIDGWMALQDGRTQNPAALLFGPPRE